jgi:hypothetical protein
MAGFFSGGEYSFVFILFLIMIIMMVIALKLDMLRDWRTAPAIMTIGFITLYYLHPWDFT